MGDKRNEKDFSEDDIHLKLEKSIFEKLKSMAKTKDTSIENFALSIIESLMNNRSINK